MHSIISTEETDANARLIAAAPDMYEALVPFANFACDPDTEDEKACECFNCKARTALAKARGK